MEDIERFVKKDQKLGSGAFGDNFLADDSHLPRKLVVKVIGSTTHFRADSISVRSAFPVAISPTER